MQLLSRYDVMHNVNRGNPGLSKFVIVQNDRNMWKERAKQIEFIDKNPDDLFFQLNQLRVIVDSVDVFMIKTFRDYVV